MGRGSAIVLMTIITITTLNASMAHLYIVGDTEKWNLNVDLATWASRRNFKVGDTLLFSYNVEMHNVYEVSQADYVTCNYTNPRKKYADGNTIVTLEKATNYYFICGIPGHCTIGMKMEVNVKEGPLAPVITPSVEPPTISTRTTVHSPTPFKVPSPISIEDPNGSSPSNAPQFSPSSTPMSFAVAPSISTLTPSPSFSSSSTPMSSPRSSMQNFTSISPSTSVVVENPNTSTSLLISIKLKKILLLLIFLFII